MRCEKWDEDTMHGLWLWVRESSVLLLIKEKRTKFEKRTQQKELLLLPCAI